VQDIANGFVSTLGRIETDIAWWVQLFGILFAANPALFIEEVVELPFLPAFLVLTSPIWIPLGILLSPIIAILA
jgi:hypothetical protein